MALNLESLQIQMQNYIKQRNDASLAIQQLQGAIFVIEEQIKSLLIEEAQNKKEQEDGQTVEHPEGETT